MNKAKLKKIPYYKIQTTSIKNNEIFGSFGNQYKKKHITIPTSGETKWNLILQKKVILQKPWV